MSANANHHLVAPEDACPRCGERNQDRLVWTPPGSDTVRCATCGHTYDPQAPRTGGDNAAR
jgi:uncharacterized Zn finger protein